MKIPKTTKEMPYLEFYLNKKGKLIKIIATNGWWGGINGGFKSSEGYRGNSCKPKDLNRYIKALKYKEIKEIEKQIETLNKKLQELYKDLVIV